MLPGVLDQRADLALAGHVGRHLQLRAGHDRPAPRRRGGRGRRRAPTAGAGRRRAPRSARAGRPASCPAPARARSSACPARGISASIAARQHRRVGLGVRDPQLAHQRLADDVVEAEQRRVERVGAEDRAERERRRVALGALACRAPSRSASRRAARPSPRPGWRAACRASRRRARARSSRSPAAAPRAGRPSAAGRRARPAGRTRPSAASWPSGSRWIRVISAPGERRRQRRDPAAADRGDRLRDVDHPPAAERDQVGRRRRRRSARAATSFTGPGGTWWKHGRVLGELDRRRAHRPLGGQQLVAARSRGRARISGASATTPARKWIVRSPSRQVNSFSLTSPEWDSNPRPADYKASCSAS